jgi:hypothetical protein
MQGQEARLTGSISDPLGKVDCDTHPRFSPDGTSVVLSCLTRRAEGISI